MIDRNRKDSLQLLRIQNDLNLLAVAMRDMIGNDEPYPLTAWSAQFQRNALIWMMPWVLELRIGTGGPDA